MKSTFRGTVVFVCHFIIIFVALVIQADVWKHESVTITSG